MLTNRQTPFYVLPYIVYHERGVARQRAAPWPDDCMTSSDVLLTDVQSSTTSL